MKLSLYSNKLDILYNQLGREKINFDNFYSMKNNLNTIKSVYDKEADIIEYKSKINTKRIIEDDKKEKPKNLNIQIINKKNNNINLFDDSKKMTINNKKINLDYLTNKLANRYNKEISKQNKSKEFNSRFDKKKGVKFFFYFN